jgi:protein-tyrosine phosphatase
VPDPFYGGPEGFDDVLAMIERTARALVEELGLVR